MSPEISVIISTFNRQQSLSRTIDCLLEQQDAPAYEIVIVDNRSTDTTAATVHLYSARDERVRYIYEPRQGVSHGRKPAFDMRGHRYSHLRMTILFPIVTGSRESALTFANIPMSVALGEKFCPGGRRRPPHGSLRRNGRLWRYWTMENLSHWTGQTQNV